MNVYWKMGCILLVCLAIAGAYAYGRHDGKKLERSEWNAREAELTSKAAADLEAARKEAKKAELAQQAALLEAHTYFQQQMKEKQSEMDKRVADALSGKRKLFVNAKCPVSGSNVPGTDTAERGSDGSARAELQPSDGAFLVGEAGHADEIVLQLQLAQRELMACYKLRKSPAASH